MHDVSSAGLLLPLCYWAQGELPDTARDRLSADTNVYFSFLSYPTTMYRKSFNSVVLG